MQIHFDYGFVKPLPYANYSSNSLSNFPLSTAFLIFRNMDFDFAIVSLLSFLIVVLVGNFIAKKRYKKKKESSNDIYPLY